ncbi:TetR/AcrR family transcriptional regulator [Loigolactobacillus coryniformis]|uniref:TetR/AcrR family transcriptional regulator n=1 Tax=Loigolactobacillus coryniformis TaxID=1610 RepID=UPI00345D6100
MNTKQLILTTAYQLFQARSYQEVSITDICTACNLTKPAFYYHFSSKSELLIHYYKRVVETLSLNIDTKTADYWQQYLTYFTELVQASIKLGPDMISQLFITNLTVDKGSFDFIQKFADICIELITQAQATGQVRTRQRPKNLFITSAFLFTGYEVYWAIKNDDFDQIKNVLSSLEVLFDVAPEFSHYESTTNLLHNKYLPDQDG